MSQPIDIDVKTAFLPEQSHPKHGRYVFRYTITIANRGEAQVQLISRHWTITDAEDQVQEVEGIGVVGEQPCIEPGKSYTYTSGAILATETGLMEGRYQMRAHNDTFGVSIPTFALVPPHAVH